MQNKRFSILGLVFASCFITSCASAPAGTQVASAPPRLREGGLEEASTDLKESYIGMTASFEVQTLIPKWAFHFEIQGPLPTTKPPRIMTAVPGAGYTEQKGIKYPVLYRVTPGGYEIVKTSLKIESGMIQQKRFPETIVPFALNAYLPRLDLKQGDFVYLGEVHFTVTETLLASGDRKQVKMTAVLNNEPLKAEVWKPYATVIDKAKWFYIRKGKQGPKWEMAR